MFKDKIIVITGAARGLGKALAEIFSREGARVVISDKNEKELKETAEAIKSVPIVADVTREEDVSNLAKKVFSEFGKIDVWINNAGIWLPRESVETVNMKRAHDMIEVNLFGTAYGSRVAVSAMKVRNEGIIVNIISTSALSGRPLSAMYSASKHAAKGFTDSLREEVRGSKLKIIGVYPGGMKTNLFDEKKPDDFDKYMSAESVAQKVVENLEQESPKEELIIRRPGQAQGDKDFH